MSTEQFQIHMFHFRCPICGSTPKQVLLRDYLREWSTAPPHRVYSLLCAFSGALSEVSGGQSRWLTKKFSKAAERVQTALKELPFDPPLLPESSLKVDSPDLRFETMCPVCSTYPGPRTRGNYFTDWPHACKVQTANLLYETGLIIWGVLLGLPHWAGGTFLQQLNAVRGEIRRAGQDMSFLECPQCGRLTSCLYGADAKVSGFCRWCLDMGGGMGFGFSVSFEPDGQPVIAMAKTDPAAPAKNAWDILPPEISHRLNS
jgi:hypothetical protein